MNKLSDDELAVLSLTADLYNAIAALPDKRPFDMDETAMDIHRIQQRIMSRLARRVHSEFFANK